MRSKAMKFRVLLMMAILSLSSLGGICATDFQAKAPRMVAAQERFRIEFVVTDGRGEGFTAPTFSGLSVLAGPSVSSGTYISIVGGQQTTTVTQTYTYVVEPISGITKAKVSGASIKVDGRTLRTSEFAIDVVEDKNAGNNSGNTSGRRSSAGTGQSTLRHDDILLRMNVNRQNVYKGEAITATLKIYTRVGISGLSEPKYPSFNGFWAQELDVPAQEPKRETISGKLYDSQVIRMWILYPQKSGMLTIEQSEFAAMAQIVTQGQSSGNSLFDDFFGGGPSVETVKRKIVSPALKIQVRELPQPAPEGFVGAVGRFEIESSVSSEKLQANAGGSFKLKISGTGNFPLLEAPAITLPQTIEQYNIKTSEQITYTTSGGSGFLEWEYPFIARVQGNYTIDPVKFVYFDPSSGSYKTLLGKTFELVVTPDRSGGAMISGSSKEDLNILGQDIRFIKTNSAGLSTQGNWLIAGWGFYSILALELLVFGVVMVLLRRRIELHKDTAKLKNKTANKVAIRRLKAAKGYITQNQRTLFFQEMLRALWGYIGDKLMLSAAELNSENVSNNLAIKNIDSQTINNFMNIIEQCEMAQYLSSEQVAMDQVYGSAIEVISRLEKEL